MAYKLRFRKSIRLGPVRFNFGKNGYNSTSIGIPGLTTNFGKKGTRSTIGLPGTGLSWYEYTKYNNSNPSPFTWGPAPKAEPGTELAQKVQSFILGGAAVFFVSIFIYCWMN